MRNRYNRSYKYRFTNPPKALLKARLDNIAIVPASMLGLKALWQTAANTLPQGGVLLCHSQPTFKGLWQCIENFPVTTAVSKA
jgi:hypothetical protein